MKNVVLAIAAACALIAIPVWAQYNAQPAQPSTTTTTTTATTSQDNLTNTQQPTEERTNPSVPTHSEDPGLTATGTVVSWNDDEVVLRTSTGLTHFKLLPATVGNRTFTEGESISIDFSRNEQGVLLAKQIRSAGAATTTSSTTTSTTPEPESTETTASTSTAMPATASNAPLVGLLGLLALGGAVALRRL